jgi:hypothetical protein
MVRKQVLVATTLAVVAALLLMPGTAQAAVFTLSAKLFPNDFDPTATGRVEWQFDGDDGSMRLTVDVGGITIDDEVFVLINWRFVGTMQLVEGKGHMNLNTNNGDLVPRAKAGHPVLIFSASCWNILEGTLQKN